MAPVGVKQSASTGDPALPTERSMSRSAGPDPTERSGLPSHPRLDRPAATGVRCGDERPEGVATALPTLRLGPAEQGVAGSWQR